jgi:hypothetical protein
MGFDICPDPIFVIGSFRSGTSVLADSLGQHSELWYSSAETNFVCNLFTQLDLEEAYERGSYWLRQRGITPEAFAAYVGLGINALFTRESGGKRWIEKTPRNALVADVLADAFPGASFVHILRDGRTAVHSMINFMDAIAEETKAQWRARNWVPEWSQDFRTACKTWREHVTKAMEFQRNRPERCLTVRYQELVADPERIFGAIFQFLDVAPEIAPLDFFRSNRVQSSFPHSRGSRADPWEEWSAEQRRTFLQEASETMLRCGLISEEELRNLERR